MFKKVRKNLKSSYLYNLLTNFFGNHKKSYSESFGEDLFVDFFFKEFEKGFYVDVGCNLPKPLLLLIFSIKKGGAGLI